MFARAEAVDAEIHAFARKLARLNVANLDPICQAAGGCDAEVGKNGMARVGVGNSKFLRLRAYSTPVDFILVSGSPVMLGGQRNLRQLVFWHATNDSEEFEVVKAELFQVIHGLFTPDDREGFGRDKTQGSQTEESGLHGRIGSGESYRHLAHRDSQQVRTTGSGAGGI